MILALLRQSPSSVNELHAALSKVASLSQSSLSQHLALLRAHRLVRFEKCGQQSRYSIDESFYLPLIDDLCTTPGDYLQERRNGS